jgi:hypothetical protein
MPVLRDRTLPSEGEYVPGPAPSFIGSTPADGTSFTVNAGTNSTYATFQASGLRGNFIRYSISGSTPTGVVLDASTGVLSGTQSTLTYGHIGGPNTDIYGGQNAINLASTYGSPSKSFSFSVTATEFNPTLAISNSVTRNYSMTLNVPFKFRQIITRGYTISGYRDVVTFRSCNLTVHATDTTTNVGDQIQQSFNYKCGANGHSIHYAFGAGNGHVVASTFTAAFNMRTETQFGNLMNLASPRVQAGCAFNEYYWAWVTGSGTEATEEFNLSTETRTSSNVGNSGMTAYAWAMNGETFAIFYGDGGWQRTFTYATRSFAARGQTLPGNMDQQKSVQSKNGFGWAGGDGTYMGGFFFRKTNMVTNTLQSSNIGTKPIQNCGEENPDMGQDWQYVIGTFDGAQNNRAWRYNYATDSGFEGGASMQSKGVPGRSSGTNGWRD